MDTSEELGLWSKNVTRYLLNKICDIEKKKKKKKKKRIYKVYLIILGMENSVAGQVSECTRIFLTTSVK